MSDIVAKVLCVCVHTPTFVYARCPKAHAFHYLIKQVSFYNWSRVDSQCYVCFRCTIKWFICVCVCMCVCMYVHVHACVCVCVCSVTSVISDCNLTDCSLPGSSVHGILQVRILEWAAMPSKGSSQPWNRTWISCIAGWFFTSDPRGHIYNAHMYSGGQGSLVCCSPWDHRIRLSDWTTNNKCIKYMCMKSFSVFFPL